MSPLHEKPISNTPHLTQPNTQTVNSPIDLSQESCAIAKADMHPAASGACRSLFFTQLADDCQPADS
jgi:hypothetical protein